MAFATNADARTRLQEATGGWRARRRLLPPPPGSGRECSGHVGRIGRVTLMCRTCAGAPHSSGTPEDWNARMPRTSPATPGSLLPADEVVARSELVLLAVPDDALPDLVDGLAATGAVRRGTLLVHVSGRYGLGVLAPAVRCGALPLALHPIMTFTGSTPDLERLSGASFGVTAPEPLEVRGRPGE